MREVYNASRPDESSEYDLPWRSRNAPAVVKAWWPLFLLKNVTENLVDRAWTLAEAPGEFRFVAAISIVGGVISIVSMGAAIWLVSSVSKRQAIQADAIGLGDVPRSEGIQGISVAFYNFTRLEVEHRSALGCPLAPVPVEDGGGCPQISDGFDVFHSPPFNGLEADRHADQADQVTGRAITGKDQAGLEGTLFPGQPARFSGRSSRS